MAWRGGVREDAGTLRGRRNPAKSPETSGEPATFRRTRPWALARMGRRGELGGATGLKTPIDTPERPDYSTTKWL